MHRAELAKVGVLSSVSLVVMYSIMYETKRSGHMQSVDRLFIGAMSELLKCGVSLGCLWAEQRGKKKALGYTKEYCLFGVFSSYQCFVWLFVAQQLPSMVLQIVGHSKTFFVFLLSMAILRRKYSQIKMVSQAGLFAGLVLPALVAVSQMDGKDMVKGFTATNCVCSLFALSACFSGALSGVLFEKTVKKSITCIWAGFFNYSISSFFVSLASLVVASVLTKESLCYTWRPMLSLIVLRMVESLLCGYIVIKYSLVTKVLMTVFSTCALSIPLAWQFSEPIDFSSVVSLVIIVCSLVLFNLSK
ncbi:hypothetical protein NECID01_0752 [Nematocida sp. AWRm77]|nr:hypothetical protein NECID01_0752 [Nematocida sp. AWRm77]